MRKTTLIASFLAFFAIELTGDANAAINNSTTNNTFVAAYGKDWKGGAFNKKAKWWILHEALEKVRDELKKITGKNHTAYTLLEKMIKFLEYVYWGWDYGTLQKKFKDVTDVLNSDSNLFKNMSTQYGADLQNFVNLLRNLPRATVQGTYTGARDGNVLELTEGFFGIIDLMITTLDPTIQQLQVSIQGINQTIMQAQTQAQTNAALLNSLQASIQLGAQNAAITGNQQFLSAQQSLVQIASNAQNVQLMITQAQNYTQQALNLSQQAASQSNQIQQLVQQAQTSAQTALSLAQQLAVKIQKAKADVDAAINQAQIDAEAKKKAEAAAAAALKAQQEAALKAQQEAAAAAALKAQQEAALKAQQEAAAAAALKAQQEAALKAQQEAAAAAALKAQQEAAAAAALKAQQEAALKAQKEAEAKKKAAASKTNSNNVSYRSTL